MGPQVEIVLEAHQIVSAQNQPISHFYVTLQLPPEGDCSVHCDLHCLAYRLSFLDTVFQKGQ